MPPQYAYRNAVTPQDKKDLNMTNIDASAVYLPDSMLHDVVVMFIKICDWSGDFINAKAAERTAERPRLKLKLSKNKRQGENTRRKKSS
jgi:hypothetical protein